MYRKLVFGTALGFLMFAGDLWASTTGKCGTNCSYTMDDNGHVVISGSGTLGALQGVDKADIKSVSIEEGITGIGGWVFNGASLTEVTIPSSVSEIGEGVFNRTPLDRVNILGKDVKVQLNSFNNTTVTNMKYAGTVTWSCGTDCVGTLDQSGHAAFTGQGTVNTPANFKSSIKSATVGEGITGIGGSAFSGSNLASIDLPDSLESIGNYAFANTKLTEVTVPSSVSDTGDWAFYNTSLDTINILNDNVKMGASSFYGASVKDFIYTGTITWPCGTDCTATFDQDGHVTVEGTGTMTSVSVLNILKPYVISATIGEGITGIGGYTFSGSNLASIDLPDSLESIAFNAFGGTKLSGIILPPDFQTLDSGAFYGMNKNNIKLFYYSDEQKEKLKELGYKDTSLTPYIINDDGTVYYTDDEGYDVRFETYKTFKRGDVLEKYRLGADGKTYVYSPDNVLLKAFKKNADGSIYIYDTDGNLKEIRGKKIYTVEEAMAVTREGNVNRVRLTYK